MDTGIQAPKSYEEAMAAVERAKREAEEIRQRELRAVIEDVKHKISLYGLTAKDLGFAEATSATKAKRNSGAAPGAAGDDGEKKDKRSEVQPKYKGPNGELWSGRGRTPAWMDALIKEGAKAADFLITSDS